jgi:hypothetical protein
MEYIFILILVGLIFAVYHYRPFKRFGFPPNADTGAMIIISSALVINLASIFIAQDSETTAALQPCGSATLEGQCYRLPAGVCKTLWEKYQDDCSWEIKKDLADRPTALIGPPVKKCTKLKFDKALYYARKSEDESPCKEYFKSLEP